MARAEAEQLIAGRLPALGTDQTDEGGFTAPLATPGEVR